MKTKKKFYVVTTPTAFGSSLWERGVAGPWTAKKLARQYKHVLKTLLPSGALIEVVKVIEVD